MIDEHNKSPEPKPLSLRELVAMCPLPEGAAEQERQQREEWEAWYAGLQLHREILVLPLKNACEITPMGWQELLFETHIKLRSTIGRDAHRHKWLDNAKVWASDEELEFKFDDAADPVFLGIGRRATRRSRWTCIECGRRGRRRELGDDYVGTMCPRCVATPLMRQQIDELRQVLPILFELGQPVKQGDVPEYLRPSFREACELEKNAAVKHASMPLEQFRCWAEAWLAVGAKLRSDDD